MSPRREVAQVTVGAAPPSVEQVIQRHDLVRYAGASGDFNPIHWNEEWARSVGLPGVIAHGMYSMAVAARMISAYAGDPAAIKRLPVRFWGEEDDGNRVLSKGEAELELA